MEKNNLKLYAFYNHNFYRLKERFLKTFKDDYEINCIYNDISTDKKEVGGGINYGISRQSSLLIK